MTVRVANKNPKGKLKIIPSKSAVFKSYLRQLIRQLKALKKAHDAGDDAAVSEIIEELLKDAQDGLEDD